MTAEPDWDTIAEQKDPLRYYAKILARLNRGARPDPLRIDGAEYARRRAARKRRR